LQEKTTTPTVTDTPAEDPVETFPARFQECAIMEPTLPVPLRWVYLDGGDLWVWDEGLEPISLTGSGDVTGVIQSLVNDRIVFSRKPAGGPASIWSTGPDGTGMVELTVGAQLNGEVELHSFSFDGSKIAFTHLLTEKTGELWSADLDGSGALLLAGQDQLMEIVLELLADGVLPAGVAWLPGTYVLAFDARPTFEAGGLYIYIQEQVWYADAMTGAVAEKFPAGEGGAVSFSPDGTLMLIARLDGLRLMNIEAAELHPLGVPYAQIGFGEYYAAPALAWPADAQSILVALLDDDQDPYAAEAGISVWEAPVNGSPATRLLRLNGFFPSFVFSTHFDKIAFWSAGSEQPNFRELHIAALDGSEYIVYAAGPVVEFLGWSPFDTQFVYGYFETGEAFLGDLCGDPVPLGRYPANLRWLDAGTFVFEVQDEAGGRLEVYEGRPDGAVELRLNLELGSWYEAELQK
jgi:hypothetical protein